MEKNYFHVYNAPDIGAKKMTKTCDKEKKMEHFVNIVICRRYKNVIMTLVV